MGALFFLAPGCGNLVGTFVGGRWADVVVKRWIKKRDGKRVPHDRLRSCLPTLAFVMPVCALVYGWTVEKAKGGYPVPIIAMFIQGKARHLIQTHKRIIADSLKVLVV